MKVYLVSHVRESVMNNIYEELVLRVFSTEDKAREHINKTHTKYEYNAESDIWIAKQNIGDFTRWISIDEKEVE